MIISSERAFMKRRRFGLLSFTAGLVALSLAFIGCELDNADSVTRDVDADFTGFYTGNSGPLVSDNSGAEVSSLNLRQTGDEIELIDNNGLVFRGTLGEVTTDGGTATASFQFTGQTTAGQDVTGSGTLVGQGTSGTMTGTWIEPSLYGTISGIAVINPVVTNSPNPNPTQSVALAISPTSKTLSNNGDSQTFSATGGSGTYSWSIANVNLGGINNPTGPSTFYQRNANTGTNTIKVTDTLGATASAPIIQL
jgi:hypothetical protein